MRLNWVDYLIMAIYFAFVLGIGAVLKKRMKSSDDFFSSGKSIPLWIASLAFISANLGRARSDRNVRLGREVRDHDGPLLLGRGHPRDDFPRSLHDALLLWKPGTLGAGIPEASLRRENALAERGELSRHDSLFVAESHSTRSPSSWSSCSDGTSRSLLLVTAGIVLVYTYLGGLTSAIYNEVLQFFLIVLGISPLVYAGLRKLAAGTVSGRSPAGDDSHLAQSRLAARQPDGSFRRHSHHGTGLRSFLRLLVHGLSGGPESDGRAQYSGPLEKHRYSRLFRSCFCLLSSCFPASSRPLSSPSTARVFIFRSKRTDAPTSI